MPQRCRRAQVPNERGTGSECLLVGVGLIGLHAGWHEAKRRQTASELERTSSKQSVPSVERLTLLAAAYTSFILPCRLSLADELMLKCQPVVAGQLLCVEQASKQA